MGIDAAKLKRVDRAERVEDENLPRLGFGMMRLPKLAEGEGDEPPVIDMDQVEDMVDAYMAAGMNYFDTAYNYLKGRSEEAVGRLLVDRYPRDTFFLATKLPRWFMEGPEDADRILNEQLERTGAGYFDLYLLHCVDDGDHYDGYKRFGCFEWGAHKREEGLIRHFGFSFHGTPELLDKILSEQPEPEFVQLQINYLDWDNPVIQSRVCYEICREHGIPVIIMEPVKGGHLADPVPAAAQILSEAEPDATPASWALRFASSLEGVLVTLSGMSTREQMADNVRTLGPGFTPLTDDERAVLDRAVEAMRSAPTIPCTGCRYCTDGCPAGIRIPDIIRALNAYRLDSATDRAKTWYERFTEGAGRAFDCQECGQCEGVCPQHLPIREYMAEAMEVFDGFPRE